VKRGERIAFIGAGNMGSAMIRGLIKSGVAKPSQIMASDLDAERVGALAKELKIAVAKDNRSAVEWCDLVVLAVKPQVLDEVLHELGDIGSKLVLSIVAGATIAKIQSGLGGKAKVVRAMPNTPALVGAGISAFCAGSGVTATELKGAQKILGAVGETVLVKKEELLDAVTGLSGSGPAYVFLVIEALADGGVLMGLDRETALKLAVQTVLGSAKLLIETGKHPAQLREMVTSPGGTTAMGLKKLEQKGVRGAFISAVKSATERARELGKK
jgi:pyrroline-5-carboxylate reductase